MASGRESRTVWVSPPADVTAASQLLTLPVPWTGAEAQLLWGLLAWFSGLTGVDHVPLLSVPGAPVSQAHPLPVLRLSGAG